MENSPPSRPAPAGRALLHMRGIVKQFPGVRALDGVELEVLPGEVHCVLGQNGAGKSTLIKVLAGAHEPDGGSISWQGSSVRLPHPQAAMDLGIATIYQELDLVDGLSVAENIFLGHEPASVGFVRRHHALRAAAALLNRLGHPEVEPGLEVGRLSAAGKQIVSMARALSREAKLIIMDEPSAVLDQHEVRRLFGVIGDLAAAGVAVVYISHRLEEIRQIGDRVTVLKDGRTVASGLSAAETPTKEIIQLMTGRAIAHAFPQRPARRPAGRPALSVRGLARPHEFANVSFDVHAGEVVGLAGLVGAGRSEILETIFGARKATAGAVTVGGKNLRPGSIASAVAGGLGLCPEERKSQALVLDDAVYRNVTMASMGRFSRLGFLDRSAERAAAAEHLLSLEVRPEGVQRLVRTLSGGNQQKVVLARWLLRECQVLLLDEPTRGVDVGARAQLYELIRELADAGLAVVLVSSEIAEVIGLSDRVLVISEGRVVADVPAGEIDEQGVLGMVMEGEVA